MFPRLTLDSFSSQSSGQGGSEGEDIQATPSLLPSSSSSNWHGSEVMEDGLFLLSTLPVFFVGSRSPILPIVLFTEFSSEITLFVVFHLDFTFLSHVAIDLFSHFTGDA